MDKLRSTITRKTLTEYLVLIDWSIRHHGANTWRIYNHHGKCTVFQFTSEDENDPLYDLRTDGYEINRYNYHRPFGKGGKFGDDGVVDFILANCELSAIGSGKGIDCVSICANTLDGKNAAFVSFYNHGF